MTCFGTIDSSGQCIDVYQGTPIGYDQLNRVKQRSYSDGTPTVTYSYDSYDSNSQSCSAGQSSSPSWWAAPSNPVGRLTEVSNGNSSMRYECHDKQGHPTWSSQVPNGRSPYTSITSTTLPAARPRCSILRAALWRPPSMPRPAPQR